MIYYENIIKLKNINEIDVIIILEYCERSETIWMDYNILVNFNFDIPFRKI